MNRIKTMWSHREDGDLQAKGRILEQILPLRPSEGTNPDNTLISNMPPELWKNVSVIGQSVAFCNGSPRQLTEVAFHSFVSNQSIRYNMWQVLNNCWLSTNTIQVRPGSLHIISLWCPISEPEERSSNVCPPTHVESPAIGRAGPSFTPQRLA